MYFEIDPKFRDYFEKRLQQVFLYITDECNLRCIHCLYKPHLIFHLKKKEIELETALALISDFKERQLWVENQLFMALIRNGNLF